MNLSYSIIVPVLNESAIINHTIKNILDINSENEIEIIVVDGDKGGNTINSIKYQNIIKIIAACGRGKQMNAGASIAKGDVLIFLHADTELPKEAFTLINSVIDKKSFDCGSFSLGIKSDSLIFRLIEKMVHFRTKLTNIPYGDQTIFIKKEKFLQLNGFANIPIMEDIEFMRRVKKSGLNIYVLPQQVSTSARKWEKEGIIYTTMRNWLLTSLYLLGVQPDRLVRFYYKDLQL